MIEGSDAEKANSLIYCHRRKIVTSLLCNKKYSGANIEYITESVVQTMSKTEQRRLAERWLEVGNPAKP